MNITIPRSVIDFSRGALSCFAIGLLASIAFAQNPPKPSSTATQNAEAGSKVALERPRELVALINESRVSGPELAVDTLLRLLEAKKISDEAWQKEIIEEIRRTIDQVRHATPMRLSFGKQNELNDTEDFIMDSVSTRKLDRLSFQARLISLVLQTDPLRARQMISQIGGNLGLKPRSCSDTLTYWPNDIYPVVTKVGATLISDPQKSEGQLALFFLPWIENIESPTQLRPALSMIMQVQAPASEKQMLINAFSRTIDRTFKDDRSFTGALKIDDLAERINRLSSGSAGYSTSGLAASYRSMLLRNLRWGRCTDNAIEKGQRLPEYILSFNKIFPEKPIVLDELVDAENLGTAKPSHLLQKSRTAKALRDEAIAVMGFKIVENKLIKHDQNDAAWVSKINDFISKLLSYDGTDGETQTELLMLKSSLLGAVIGQAVEPGEFRQSIIRRYLQLLVSSSLQKNDFAQWLFWVNGAESFAPEDFSAVINDFSNSNLRVLVAARNLGLSSDKR